MKYSSCSVVALLRLVYICLMTVVFSQTVVSGYFIGALISKIVVLLAINLIVKSKEEIKYEISKVLYHFSDKALSELLSFLKELDSAHEFKPITSSLNKILSEDRELLAKLAQ